MTTSVFVDNCCAGIHPTVLLAPASGRATAYDGTERSGGPVITDTEPVNAFAQGGLSAAFIRGRDPNRNVPVAPHGAVQAGILKRWRARNHLTARELMGQSNVFGRNDHEYEMLPPPCVVAIPAKNEARRLPACIDALGRQVDCAGRSLHASTFRILIFANNCSDDSADLARRVLARLPFEFRVVEASLPHDRGHAGGARRAAMDLADAWLRERGELPGIILTSDADSRVAPDWITSNIIAFVRGADAVLGQISLDEEGALLPPALHRRGRLEGSYDTLLTELGALLDPLDHNPWPHHSTISAASLAVTSNAYRRMGGLPGIPLGEDKAFVAQLLRLDGKIRYCPNVRVVTSGRIYGRAPGGVADTLRLRSRDPVAYCDEALEPFRIAIKRAKWRGRLRQDFDRTGFISAGVWSRLLGLSDLEAKRISKSQTFGAAWNSIERASSVLIRRPLRPTQLSGQIAGARRALLRLRNRKLFAGQDIETESLVAVPTNDFDAAAHLHSEEFDGFVSA
jgi:Glycosyl transferase family 2